MWGQLAFGPRGPKLGLNASQRNTAKPLGWQFYIREGFLGKNKETCGWIATGTKPYENTCVIHNASEKKTRWFPSAYVLADINLQIQG